MTANQIAYQQVAENIRHNYASEREAQRHNVADETIRHSANVETARSNLARENETHRSNVINEIETERSHRAVEQETNRANIARETETHRTNVANEALRGAELDETIRHNTTSEQLQAKSIKAGILSSQISAQGSATAAGISASASRYAADLNRINQERQQEINRMDAETRAATQKVNEAYNLQKLAIERQQANINAQESAARTEQIQNQITTNWLDTGANLINKIIGSASVLQGLR